MTSLGVRVHGGMGFIGETGAAQYYRDAKILTIYEGTTAIQANDLVGRKDLRDGGGMAGWRSRSRRRKRAASPAAAAAHACSQRLRARAKAYLAVVDFFTAHRQEQPQRRLRARCPT